MLALLTLSALLASDPLHPDDMLTGVVKTEHFVIRYREGSRAEASVDRVMVAAEADLARILARLEFPQFAETITLYLYDDVAELDDHEDADVRRLGHADVARAARQRPDATAWLGPRRRRVLLPAGEGRRAAQLVLRRGIANAVLEYVSGVHVHAVAAYEMKRGMLPALEQTASRYQLYGWLARHPGVNGYDIGGSYVLYLLETFGVRKTRRYYKGVPAKEAFGKSLADIENGWRARLAKVELRAGLEQLLRERSGQPAQFTTYVAPDAKLTPQLLGPDSAWTSLAPKEPRGTGFGSIVADDEGFVLSGPKDSGDWADSCCPVTRRFATPRSAAGRAGRRVFRRQAGTRPALSGPADRQRRVHLHGRRRSRVPREPKMGGPRGRHRDAPRSGLGDRVVRRVRVLEAQIAGDAAPVSIGVVQGRARFTQVAVRVPKG